MGEASNKALTATHSGGQTQSRYFACSDGLTLHARQQGDTGPLFVLVHGFGEGGFVWDEFTTRLPAGSVAVDLRGHGDSQWDSQRRYDARTHANDVVGVIDTLGLQRVVLVGHSMGGDIAIRVAARRPERVVGLAIVDFGPDIDPAATDHILAKFNADDRAYCSAAEYAARLSERHPFADPTLLSRFAACALQQCTGGGLRRKCDPAMGRSSASNAHERQELWSFLQKLSCRTLVTRGMASSVLAPAVANRMVATLRHGRLAVVPRAGHAVMFDNPAGFAAAVIPFMIEILYS